MITILLADDHPVVRDGLRAILETQADFAIIGECGTGEATVAQVKALKPDVLLLDLEMPQMDGVEALRRIHETAVDTRVLVFTAYDSDERILSAVQAGAQGYLLKGMSQNELVEAIKTVHAGNKWIPQKLASRAFDRASSANLTDRELDVLRLVVIGRSNKEIAQELGLQENTVKAYLTNLFAKLGVTSRTQAIAVALQKGLAHLE